MTTSTFNTLGLSKPSLEAIENLGFTEPTPVQALSIPPGIAGKDILAAAQTGTGKTLAYLLPIFDQMVRHFGSKRPKKGPYALVLAYRICADLSAKLLPGNASTDSRNREGTG